MSRSITSCGAILSTNSSRMTLRPGREIPVGFRQDKIIHSYTVKVGDICMVAIGPAWAVATRR